MPAFKASEAAIAKAKEIKAAESTPGETGGQDHGKGLAQAHTPATIKETINLSAQLIYRS